LEKEIAAKDQRAHEQQKFYPDLSGEIAGAVSKRSEPNLDRDFDTLDEPVWVTVKRDLNTVGAKFGLVLFPTQGNQSLLRNWDLWGPLFICVFISLLLHSSEGKMGPHFTEVFTLTFFGACIVTLNIKLLGGTISFFQSLCVLGYCLLPPGAAAVLCKVLTFASEQSSLLFVIRLLVTSVGFVWATYASMAFLAGAQPPRRKALAIYPIFLFYFVISWMIISHSH
uniref:Protein YIPF n=1 Tax=Plectus sambesii TaxID=2011161 RepID=A0A914UQ31_9BILA